MYMSTIYVYTCICTSIHICKYNLLSLFNITRSGIWECLERGKGKQKYIIRASKMKEKYFKIK